MSTTKTPIAQIATSTCEGEENLYCVDTMGMPWIAQFSNTTKRLGSIVSKGGYKRPVTETTVFCEWVRLPLPGEGKQPFSIGSSAHIIEQGIANGDTFEPAEVSA